MKKVLLILSVFGLFTITNGQTLSSSDFGSIGDSYVLGTDGTPGAGPGSSGSGQTWNFTGFNTETLDTLHFVDPSLMPNASDFPGSNIATESNEGVFFMEKNSSKVSTHGLVGSFAFITASIVFTPPLDIIQFPASMGTNFSSSSTTDIITYVGIDTNILGCQIIIDSIWVKRYTDMSVNFDASGTIQLPTDTFTNSLRSFTQQETIDSIFIYAPNAINCAFPPIAIPMGWSFADPTLMSFAGFGGNPVLDTTRIFTWYVPGEDFSVCAMDVNYALNPVSVRFKSDISVFNVGINEPFNVISSVYPNPANDQIRVISDEAMAGNLFTVIDMNGKRIFSAILSEDGIISTSSLNNGVYLYMISDQQDKPLSKGKFVVQK